MMTLAKGPTYIQSYFLPSLLQLEQILNKLEKGFQWLPKPNLFDLKKANFCRIPKLKSLKLNWINHNYHIFKNIFIQYFFRLRFFLKAWYWFLIDTVFQIIQKYL